VEFDETSFPFKERNNADRGRNEVEEKGVYLRLLVNHEDLDVDVDDAVAPEEDPPPRRGGRVDSGSAGAGNRRNAAPGSQSWNHVSCIVDPI